MLVKSITYTDYFGNKRTEDFYFNLNKVETAEMETSVSGGLSKMIEELSTINDEASIFKIVKNFILTSYGVRSEDGRRFIKSEKLKEEFSQTEAFVELFTELGHSAEAASEFIEGVIPSVEK